MLSPVSSSRCICNFIPNGETSLITCSLSAGRSVTRTKGPPLPPERLRGTRSSSDLITWHCQGSAPAPSPHCCPGKLRPEGGSACSASHSMAPPRLLSLSRGATWRGEALGHFPGAKANPAMALGFPRLCPARAGRRCGDSLGTPSPLKITVARGVFPAVGPFGGL